MPTVYIWLFAKRISTSAGHAGMAIEPGADAEAPATYVTWLGDIGSSSSSGSGSSGGRSSGLSPGLCSVTTPKDAVAGWNYDRDMRYVGGGNEPDSVITVPPRGGGNRCGVDSGSISTWWSTRILPNLAQLTYKMISTEHNCCAYVVKGLLQGNADRYAAPPKNYVYQGTATLKTWIETLRDSINRINGLLTYSNLVRLLGDWTREHEPIWPAATWTTRSAVKIGGRKDQVATIDRLLPRYHAMGPDRVDLLWDILGQVADHRNSKPASDRRAAVTRLGHQVCRELARLGLLLA